MTTVDEARAALLDVGYANDGYGLRACVADFEAAVRADQLAVCGEWHRDAEANLAALREEMEHARKRIRRLFKSYEHESLEAERGLLDAVLEAVLGIVDAALAATPAEEKL